jgi:hypothetical protein
MSDELERLRRWVSAVTPADWQASEAGKLLDAALSRARAEALEEAVAIIQREAAVIGVKGLLAAATSGYIASIRSAVGAAPTSIPVERVREVFSNNLYVKPASGDMPLREAWFNRGVLAVARDLGVDFDAKVATPADASHTCVACKHRLHAPNCCLGDKGECDCGWVP